MRLVSVITLRLGPLVQFCRGDVFGSQEEDEWSDDEGEDVPRGGKNDEALPSSRFEGLQGTLGNLDDDDDGEDGVPGQLGPAARDLLRSIPPHVLRALEASQLEADKANAALAVSWRG